MRILAIDPATVTGYAVLYDHEVTHEGIIRTGGKKEPRGKKLSSLGRWMSRLAVNEKIDFVVFERQFRGLGLQFEGIILSVCETLGIPYVGVHIGELKKWATGNGHATKAEMIEASERFSGDKISDDNIADAVLLGFWALNNAEL